MILAVSPAGMGKLLGPEHQKQLLSEWNSGGLARKDRGKRVKKCALRPLGLGRERKPLRGATQFQTQNASLWPFLCGREKPHLSPGPLLALSWAAPSPAALSTKGPLSVGGCFAYSCAVIAVDGGILPRNQEKVKGLEAKSDFNTVEDKLKALSAQCAHWAPPPQGEARGA